MSSICSCNKFNTKYSKKELLYNDTSLHFTYLKLADAPVFLVSKSNDTWLGQDFYNFKFLANYAIKKIPFIHNGPDKVKPIIANNCMFFLNSKGILYAFALSTERFLWQKKIVQNNTIQYGGMTYTANTLFLTLGSREIYALNSKTGEKIWHKTLQAPLYSAPLVLNAQYLAVATIDNQVYVLDIHNGEIAWNYSGPRIPLSRLIASRLAYSHNTLFFLSNQGIINALQNMRIIWSENLNISPLEQATLLPKLVNNQLVIVKKDTIQALQASTGKEQWIIKGDTKNLGPITKQYLAGVIDNKLVLIMAQNSARKEIISLAKYKQSQWFTPVLANGLIWLLSNKGILLGINIHSKTIVKELRITKHEIIYPLMIAKGKMYLYDKKANLIVIS